MNINKFTNDLDDTPFHSSSYAKAANGNEIGAVSPQSFNQRLHVEGNRQRVRKYRDSMIAHGHHRSVQLHRIETASTQSKPVPDATSHTTQKPGRPNGRTTGRSLSGFTRPTTPRQNFNEPTSRGFNPYK